MVNKVDINNGRYTVALHILRARIVQMMKSEGYDLRDKKWEFKFLNPSSIPSNLVFNTLDDEPIMLYLNPRSDLLSGRTRFSLYTSTSGKMCLSTQPNIPRTEGYTKHPAVNCRECSGRQFVSEYTLSYMLSMEGSDIRPCPTCNDDFELKEVTK